MSLLPQTLLIDADDTLWENNIYFERAIANFISFLNHREFTPQQVRFSALAAAYGWEYVLASTVAELDQPADRRDQRRGFSRRHPRDRQSRHPAEHREGRAKRAHQHQH